MTLEIRPEDQVVAKPVKCLLESMRVIHDSQENVKNHVIQNNEKINEITLVIQEIGSKTKVINDIVFQTKLLSFNASVEAARAGESGKGFAVVAEEVGNLAQMSGNAAKEISDLLESSIHKVKNLVQETKGAVESIISDAGLKIEQGNDNAKACGELLEQIVQNVADVSHSIQEISSASTEQSKGIDEIAKAVVQIDSTTQSNSSMSSFTAQASQSLSQQAESFAQASAALIEIVEGKNAAAKLEVDGE